MLPFIPQHFLCTHFWQLVHCIATNISAIYITRPSCSLLQWLLTFSYLLTYLRYGDGAGNTVEENSSVFSLIQVR